MKGQGSAAEALKAVLDGCVRAFEVTGYRCKGFARAYAAENLREVEGSLGEVIEAEGGG